MLLNILFANVVVSKLFLRASGMFLGKIGDLKNLKNIKKH